VRLDAGVPTKYETRALVSTMTMTGRCRTLTALLVGLAIAGAGCSGDSGHHLTMPSPSAPSMPMPTPEPTRPPVLSAMPLPTAAEAPAEAQPPQRYEGSNAAVEAKVGEIEALGPDHSEAATSSLLRAAESASVLISAAAIRGLSGRGCDRVQPLLVRLLDDSEWQRRAWAAKVLGDNGCKDAQPWLVAHSKSEQDNRVRSRLEESIRHLEGKK